MDLDDLHETNEELAEAVMKNTRRYTNMVSDVVYEMIPEYKHKDVSRCFIFLLVTFLWLIHTYTFFLLCIRTLLQEGESSF